MIHLAGIAIASFQTAFDQQADELCQLLGIV